MYGLIRLSRLSKAALDSWRRNMSAKRQYRMILTYNNSKIYADTILHVAKKLKS